MFKSHYTLMGISLCCSVITTQAVFDLESKSYTYIKKLATAGGYKYQRMETVSQDGFPDIQLFKGKEYCLIEAKMLKQKTLISLEDSLEWQFGQIGFALRALSLNMEYVLTVCKDNKLAIIGKEYTLCRLKSNLNY